MEQENPQAAITQSLAEPEDPRWYNRRHKLLDPAQGTVSLAQEIGAREQMSM